jgi:hypothetical protein
VKRTWVVAPIIVVLVLLVMAGVTVMTLRLVDRDGRPERGAGPADAGSGDLCDRVDPAPLARVRLTEPRYRRTVRQTEYEGVVTDTCEMSLQMDDVAPPADPSTAVSRDALFFVHVTHHPDAAAAAADFRFSKRSAEGAVDVTGMPEGAYVSFGSGQVAGYREVELRAHRGAEGLTIRVYAMRTSEWDRDGIRAAFTEIARRVLAT